MTTAIECMSNNSESSNRAALVALKELLPFVLDDYYPTCATPEFKRAVEKAKQVIEGSNHGARPAQPDQ